MFKFYFYCLCLLCATYVEARCTCDKLNKHYDELGCKPIYAKEEDCCPSHYDCDEVVKRTTNNTVCYFDNKEYKQGDQLEHSQTSGNCMAGCFCSKNEWADFTCAHIDCPEFLGVPVLPGCTRTYSPNSCCSTGVICAEGATCTVGNETYSEGQRMYPPGTENQCLSCVCLRDFEGKFVEPYCRPITCGTQLKALEVRKNCAPVYYNDNKCCPIQWQCDDEEETTTSEATTEKKTETTETPTENKSTEKTPETKTSDDNKTNEKSKEDKTDEAEKTTAKVEETTTENKSTEKTPETKTSEDNKTNEKSKEDKTDETEKTTAKVEESTTAKPEKTNEKEEESKSKEKSNKTTDLDKKDTEKAPENKKVPEPVPDNACRFGHRIIKNGDKIQVNRKYSSPISCECITPPLLTCSTSEY